MKPILLALAEQKGSTATLFRHCGKGPHFAKLISPCPFAKRKHGYSVSADVIV